MKPYYFSDAEADALLRHLEGEPLTDKDTALLEVFWYQLRLGLLLHRRELSAASPLTADPGVDGGSVTRLADHRPPARNGEVA